MRRILGLWLAAGLGCVRSVPELPEPAEGGFLNGRVVERALTSGDLVGLPGVRVVAVGTSISAVTNPEGRFQLQRLALGRTVIRLERVPSGARPGAARVLEPVFFQVDGQSIDLGDLRLSENGGLTGEVIKKDDPQTLPEAAAGALVVVPQTPFKAVVDQDGLWTLPGLPEGIFDVVALQSGYGPQRKGGIQVLPGVTGMVERITLAPDPNLPIRTVMGSARLQGVDDHVGIRIQLIDEQEPTRTIDAVMTNSAGAYQVDLQVGVYRIRFSRDGYVPMELPGVAVLAEGVVGLLPALLVPQGVNDLDGDGIPDDQDPDIDNDGCPNETDNAPRDPFLCLDTDSDGLDNSLDPDDDNDGLLDAEEVTTGLDGWVTNSLNPDTDGDGVPEAPVGQTPRDNCPTVSNPGQENTFGRADRGDVCDTPETEEPQPQPLLISGFMPTEGPIGTTVTISGQNFRAAGETWVGFGYGLGPVVWTQGSVLNTMAIQVLVPVAAPSGALVISNGARTTTTTGLFTVRPGPQVVSWTPERVRPYSALQIRGRNFREEGLEVRINGVVAGLIPVSGGDAGPARYVENVPGENLQQIRVVVPQVGSGLIEVRTVDGVGRSSGFLTVVLDRPIIDFVQPNPVQPGETLTIRGDGFATTDLLNPPPVEVSFTGAGRVPILPSSSNTALLVTVPANARTGTITVIHPVRSVSTEFPVVIDLGTPVVASVYPELITPGDIVEILGANLNGATSVTFTGGGSGQIRPGANATRIEVVVPDPVSPGPLTVNLPGQTATSAPLQVLTRAAGVYDLGASFFPAGVAYNPDNLGEAFVFTAGSANLAIVETAGMTRQGALVPLTFLQGNEFPSGAGGFFVHPSGRLALIQTRIGNAYRLHVLRLPQLTSAGVCDNLQLSSVIPPIFDPSRPVAYLAAPQRPGTLPVVQRLDLQPSGPLACDDFVELPTGQKSNQRGLLFDPRTNTLLAAVDGVGLSELDSNLTLLQTYPQPPTGWGLNLTWAPGLARAYSFSSSGVAVFEPLLGTPLRPLPRYNNQATSVIAGYDGRYALMAPNGVLRQDLARVVRAGGATWDPRVAASHPSRLEFLVSPSLVSTQIYRYTITE